MVQIVPFEPLHVEHIDGGRTRATLLDQPVGSNITQQAIRSEHLPNGSLHIRFQVLKKTGTMKDASKSPCGYFLNFLSAADIWFSDIFFYWAPF